MTDGLLEPDLSMKSCSKCDGVWLPSQAYWAWLERQHGTTRSEPTLSTGVDQIAPAADPPLARRCPECGHFLTRAKVGHGLTFHVDRCGTCGGMWFNHGEWDALRAQQLHTRLHFVFSAAWQAAVAREDRLTAHEEILRQKLGATDLDEIKRVKQWIESHPHRAELFAYLQPEDAGHV